MRARLLLVTVVAVACGCESPPRVLCPAVEIPSDAKIPSSLLPSGAVCWFEQSEGRTDALLNLPGASPRESYDAFVGRFAESNPEWRVVEKRELKPGFFVEFQRTTAECRASDTCDTAHYVFRGGDGRIPVKAAVTLRLHERL